MEDGGDDGGVDRVSYDHPLLSTILDLAIPQIACPGYERCFHRHWEAVDEVDRSQVLQGPAPARQRKGRATRKASDKCATTLSSPEDEHHCRF